jgi:hypothetical protein
MGTQHGGEVERLPKGALADALHGVTIAPGASHGHSPAGTPGFAKGRHRHENK